MNNHTAILLCAGRGSRLSNKTFNKPKPLVETNELSFLDNALQKIKSAGIKKVAIVVGYKKDTLIEHIQSQAYGLEIEFIVSHEWETTNNIYSLYLARDWIKKGSLILEGDIFFNQSCLDKVIESNGDINVLISPLSKHMEGCYAEVEKDNIVALKSTKDADFKLQGQQYKTVNIYHICSDEFANYCIAELEQAIHQGETGGYYEEIFKKALHHGSLDIKASIVPHSEWYEVDNAYDLSICDYISSSNKLELIQNRHGGYWRYPMTDFALIYNFHFPTEEFKNAMKKNFDEILLNYPGGRRLIEGSLSEFLEVKASQLCIANGAAEIIKLLPNIYKGKVLVTVPSFNEYANTFGQERTIHHFTSASENFDINVDEILKQAEAEQPNVVVIESPNNPTGRLTAIDSLLYLADALHKLDIDLIVDESFLDFSKFREETTLKHLEAHQNLSVIRSMSKTFGIGGIRIGYIATANESLLSQVRTLLPIWNINGFAEEFLLRLPQYKQSYKLSCDKVCSDTLILQKSLSSIEGITAFETDSNFVYCKTEYADANTICHLLLDIYGLYIKDCAGKGNQGSDLYFRVSCRTQSENEILIRSLQSVMQKIREIENIRTREITEGFVS
ncbi:aminotransferase class I/II-fold pyridoxal phosphate-dependent enzyme [Photobacterium galatheae]|uniref:Aminotransferase n=1 Tax=Photobacterium galatheae TaxID=1654360 RepID=A0A066RHF2_9GAMM|nr:aminotransferase class I/II-fold pyridoxal phosphate-dependent enzyme [Photobacterium galatheae]KDM89880.1 aminotransferase [Photobacterium galatheae]MCM0151174.1 aminotransferase class I/II-fold pyridoxal phosphate-dependent enzyme [Photobacterium galatheae]